MRNGDSNHSTKAPTLSERPKIVDEKTDVADEENDGPERGASHRTSIAGKFIITFCNLNFNFFKERRRLYENRSLSCQDDKTSPTPLRRKGSLKGKEDPIPEATPATKRTSTVFGKSYFPKTLQ